MNQEADLDSVSLGAGRSGLAAADSVAVVSATAAVGSGSAVSLGGRSGLAAAGSAAVV